MAGAEVEKQLGEAGRAVLNGLNAFHTAPG
jgi:hypothetical protein